MSDEGMSDAHLKALAGLYKDADDSGMESKWEAIGNALCNAYPLIIARLDAAERERDALRDALEPFAKEAACWDEAHNDGFSFPNHEPLEMESQLQVKHLRAARAALTGAA